MNEDYEFIILYDLYEEYINEHNEPDYKLKKRDCRRKWYVTDIYNITDLREIPNKQGKLYKSKCEVYHRPEAKWVTILGKYTEIKEILKKERKQVKGFYGSK